MQFSKIIGQEKLKKQLISGVQSGRIHHAQLFLSRPGIGGLPMAMAYAQYINCENPSEVDSCGQCTSCKQMEKMIHPGVYFSFPTINIEKLKSKPPISNYFIEQFREYILANPYAEEKDWLAQIQEGTKQGNITASECAEIIKSVKLKVHPDQYKIVIIWMPERLNKDGNRLLKLLEEPPDQTLLLLVSENEDSILNTILSRTQIMRLMPLNDQEIISEVTKQGADIDLAKHIALISNGNYFEAQQLVKDSSSMNGALIAEWFQSIFKDRSQLVRKTEDLAKLSREELKNLLTHGSQICREAVFLPEDIFPSRLSQKDEQIARWLGKILSLDQIKQLAELFEDAVFKVERNANSKLLLLGISVEIFELVEQREAVK